MDFQSIYNHSLILIPIVMIIVAGLKKELGIKDRAVQILACIVSAAASALYGFAIVHESWQVVAILYVDVAIMSMFGYNLLGSFFKRGP